MILSLTFKTWRIYPTNSVGQATNRSRGILTVARTIDPRHFRGPISTIRLGRLQVPGCELRSEDLDRLTRDAVLTRGLARSYGDSSLPPASHPDGRGDAARRSHPVVRRDVGRAARRGRLFAAESLPDFLPRGWFTPVTPGTQFVTLGGMVAADVHGKNHHVDGTIGRHVRAIRMRVASGADRRMFARRASRISFRATIGGMGLTGHILEVELQLVAVPSPWILGERRASPTSTSTSTRSRHRPRNGRSRWAGSTACRRAHMGRGVLSAADGRPPAKRRATFPRAADSLARADCLPVVGDGPDCRTSLQRGVLPLEPAEARRHRAPRDVLLSARYAAALESPVRPPRLHAVPVRPAGFRWPRPCASSSSC